MEIQQKESTQPTVGQNSHKDIHQIKWIIGCGILAALFLFSTEPVVPSARGSIDSICRNQSNPFNFVKPTARQKLDCAIYTLTGRVLNPRVI